MRIHGQHPATLQAHYLLYKTLMHGRSGIPRTEREMIAVVVRRSTTATIDWPIIGQVCSDGSRMPRLSIGSS